MPRNKKTKPASEYKDLPGTPQFMDALDRLTPQQRKFVFAIVDGKSQTQAYRENYDVSDPNADWLRIEACKLAADPNVAIAIRAGNLAGFGSAIATLEDHTAQLRRLRDIALDTGNVGAAVLAEHHRGKVAKLYSENIDINLTRLDDNTVIEQIRQKFGDEAADKARKRLLGE